MLIIQNNLPSRKFNYVTASNIVERSATEPELIVITDEQYEQLLIIKKLLAAHPKSGRVNPLYILFKLLAGRIVSCSNCRTMQSTLGIEMPKYGYDKKLTERQIRRISNRLKEANLLTNKKMPNNKIYDYFLTDLGRMAYWFIVKKNKGRVQIQLPVSPIESTDEKKCPVSFEKNVRSYRDPLIEKDINNHIHCDFDLVDEREQLLAIPPKPPEQSYKPKNNGVLRSEKESKKIELDLSLTKRIRSHFPLDKVGDVESTFKRLICANWERMNVFELLMMRLNVLQQKNERVKNLNGLIVTKFKHFREEQGRPFR